MKVKELIELLNKLDQEKEIKCVSGSGYEYEEQTSKEFYVKEYEKMINHCHNSKTNESWTYADVDDDGQNKDFYLLSGNDYDYPKR